MAGRCFVGCAGWSLPRDMQARFGAGGSHLERYATRFAASEINSSFHRPHKLFVWERWRSAVPAGFRFSVKLPRGITHDSRLVGTEGLLDDFFAQARLLGDRLGCILVQLPPSLAFDEAMARTFFGQLRTRWSGAVAAEPRHASWFGPAGDAALAGFDVARVLADPVRHERGAAPGGWPGLVYLRLHGSPRIYYSSYDEPVIEALAGRIRTALGTGDVWCIFDNTASGAATHNALALVESLQRLGVNHTSAVHPAHGAEVTR